MKQFLTIIFLFWLAFFPATVLAATVEGCDPGTLTCLCQVSTTQITTLDQTDPINDCVTRCKTISEANASVTQWALQCKIGGNLTPIDGGDLTTTLVGATSDVTEALGFEVQEPQLGVEIPGLNFSPAVVAGKNIAVNYLGEYINAVYVWLLSAGAILAIVMIMIGGLEWIIAHGNSTGVEKAKKRISNALIGMVLLLCAYTIAFLIDPSTVQFKTLDLAQIERIEYIQEDEETWPITPRTDIPPGEGETITGDPNLIMNGQTMNPALIEPLKKAAAEFNAATGEQIKVSSGFRPPATQLHLFYKNCVMKGGYCTPVTGIGIPSSATLPNGNKIYTKVSGQYIMDSSLNGLSETEFIERLEPYVSPTMGAHLSGVAVDVWCSKSAYGSYTFGTDCQVALMTAMMNNGFCRLAAEVWHFEFDAYKVSSSYCSLTQDKWSFDLHGKTVNFKDCVKMDGSTGVCQQYR